jgi:CTP-dependent riboflavin kinase
MPEEDRDSSGKYNEIYPNFAFISAVHNIPVASTQNVADEVGCSYDLAYRRLNSLYDSNKIEREKVGSSFVYYVPK